MFCTGIFLKIETGKGVVLGPGTCNIWINTIF